MPKLIMMKGLPGSGKTKFAKEYCKNNPNTIRINNDDIRSMMGDYTFQRRKEKLVTKVREHMLYNAMKQGFDVIIDNTNLTTSHEINYKQQAGLFGYDFEVKFIDTPLSECLANNSNRPKPVPEEVIIKMARKHNIGHEKTEFAPIKYPDGVPLRSIVICDIDGTIAQCHPDRDIYDYGKVHMDLPIIPIVSLIKKLQRDYSIVFVSGRKDDCHKETIDWLKKQFDFPIELYMRKSDDNRKDNIIKYEILQQLVSEGNYIEYSIDDRRQVVKMWREAGITTLQVADGNF